MSTRAAQQALTPGRLLLIKNSSSNLQQLAVILAKAAVQNRLLAKSPSTGERGILWLHSIAFQRHGVVSDCFKRAPSTTIS